MLSEKSHPHFSGLILGSHWPELGHKDTLATRNVRKSGVRTGNAGLDHHNLLSEADHHATLNIIQVCYQKWSRLWGLSRQLTVLPF